MATGQHTEGLHGFAQWETLCQALIRGPGAVVFWESILGHVEETDVTECLTNFMTSSRMGTVTGAATWQSSACWEIDLE